MYVRNFTSQSGNAVANQFIISEGRTEWFQSYDSIIAKVTSTGKCNGDGTVNWERTVELDSRYWDYSKTTGKYRNQFLGETKAETQRKIDSGEYVLTNLN